ncbi:MAG: hypothetical protein R3326_01570 [Gemmatimonadota bacterium]|nr:hypothetical protein [Gemmatimonadota bacterium]
MTGFRTAPGAALAALLFVLPSLAFAQSKEEDLATMRAVTEKYRDVEVAMADGYVPDPTGMCVTGAMAGDPELGDMGIHYFRPDLLGITEMAPPVDGSDAEIVWEKPELLVYVPDADGTMELVAIEYLVFESAWKAAGHEDPPAFHDQTFYRMADDPETEVDEAHAFTPHYELHVWTARENPAGMFAEFNPNVTCPPIERDEQASAGR